jgi:hypothetical protein
VVGVWKRRKSTSGCGEIGIWLQQAYGSADGRRGFENSADGAQRLEEIRKMSDSSRGSYESRDVGGRAEGERVREGGGDGGLRW